MASATAKRKVARPYQRSEGDPQPEKRAVNAWIAGCAACLRQQGAAGAAAQPSPWALVLESRRLLTVKALCSAPCGITERTIVIPNPDADELAAIRGEAPAAVALPVTSHSLIEALAAPDNSGSSTERAALEANGWRPKLGFSVVWCVNPAWTVQYVR